MTYKTISYAESQVGKYIDLNGDGIPEGVIFADLAIGGSGQWGKHPHHNDFCQYKIPTIKEFKDYIIVGEYEDKINGKQEVLAPVLDGMDRFYVMALSDVVLKRRYFTWYDAAFFHEDGIFAYQVIAKPDFGTGKQNTLNMINKWNSKEYGEQNTCEDHTDMWNEIQDEVNNGWFVPSRAEWAAFGDSLKLTKDNYSTKGFKWYYWSSSLFNSHSAYFAYFSNGFIDSNIIICDYSIRLATTI